MTQAAQLVAKRSGRHGRIAADLEAAIAGGGFAVGALLPTEAELCARYRVSRHTARRALGHLLDLGLVERRQGATTRVISSTPRAGYVHTIRSLHELFGYTRDTRLDVTELGWASIDEDAADIIPAAPRSRWLRVVGLRSSRDRRETICHVTVFVHRRFATILKRHLHAWTGPIYALIEERSGEVVTEALQEISGGPLPEDAARALTQSPGAPALRFVRRYMDADGGSMLTAVNWHPAERFRYQIRLRRDATP
ncbi:MAG: GntR family transcriptional regulator [Alphaproteobacteria bacterium]|nr:GntR family transcriptional regulator [Alphaproteobacteria bacterium]